MKIANLSLGGECLGHGGSVASNVRFWHKADMSDSDLLPCRGVTMQTKIDEIGADMYRLSIFVPEVAPPAGLTFNHFLITGDEPLLFHCGKLMVPLVSAAVARIIPLKRLPCSPPSCCLRRGAKVAAWRHIVLRKADHVREPRSRLGVTL